MRTVEPDTALDEAGPVTPSVRTTGRGWRPRWWSGVRSWHLVAACVLFTLALRMPFLTRPLGSDEAGLLIVGGNWSEGPFLYGDYFVGRGMLGVGFFALADLLGGSSLAVRLLGCLVAAALVACAGWAGHLLRGRAGAGWGALVAAAYGSSYVLSSQVTNERLLATTLVMAGCAMTLSALARPRSAVRGALAGIFVVAPLLVVQSYADGLAFASVLLLATLWTRGRSPSTIARVALGGLGGMALVLLGLSVLMATTWMTWEQLWFQMLGYRVEASRVVGDGATMPTERLEILTVVAVLSGVLLFVVTTAAALARRLLGPSASHPPPRVTRDSRPVYLAILAMLVVSFAGVVAGGDYWLDYLLQPVPALVMTAALLGPVPTLSGWATRLAATLAVASALVGLYLATNNPIFGTPNGEYRLGNWLESQSEPSDTVLIVWGQANVLHAADMESPYPYLWSLLTRTLDADLEEATSTLKGPEAPTWVVLWHPLDTWDLDSEGKLADTLRERYRPVATPCGFPVYVLKSADRPVRPTADCASI